MWPKERVAFLVIHGMGQQNPFEVLDSFVRTLWETLKEQNADSQITATHSLRDADGWIESCVSLKKDGAEETAIDCFEYYWAHETQRRIDMGEVFDWLFKAGLYGEKYYDENKQLVEAYEAQGVDAFGNGHFKKYWYLKFFGRRLWLAHKLLVAGGPLFSTFPQLAKPIQFLMRVVGLVGKPFIVDSLGDVCLYTTTDIKHEHFPVRQKILDGAVKKVEWLMQSKRPSYARIVVVGHSLGSVIAYDTLNRINSRMNSGAVPVDLGTKIRGLVTFGSPLDKITFFFRERAQRHDYVRKQLLNQLHGFKFRSWTPCWTPPAPVESGIKPLLDANTRWINFWDKKDPVSGPLDFYDIPKRDNRELQQGEPWLKAHTTYWQHKKMWEQVISDMF